jgi:hypothetical protein
MADQIEFNVRDACRALLWRRGDLSWKLRPEQLKLKSGLEAQAVQLAVYNISRRLGKTFTLVAYAIEQAIQTKQKIRFACAFLTDLEEFILPAFETILLDCPDNLRPVYTRSRKTWMFRNKSEIKLVGLDKSPQGLRGNAIAKIIIDEAGFVRNLKHIYTSVIVPATAKQKDIKVIFLSTPPPTPDHYFIALIAKAQTQENGHYVCLTIDDISDLHPDERKRLLDEVGGEHSIEAQREFFCKLIIDSTLALAPEFDRDKHVKHVTIPSYAKWWTSGDTAGLRDKDVFHLWCYDFRRAKLLCVDERSFPLNTPTTIIISEVLKMEGQHKPVRYVDAAGRTQIDMMASGFASALPRKDELHATINQVRLALTNCTVEIDPRCTLLIATLEAGTLNNNRTDLARTEALGHMDAFMSFAYGLRHADTRNPFPLHDGRRPIDVYVPSYWQDDRNTSAQALKSIFKRV